MYVTGVISTRKGKNKVMSLSKKVARERSGHLEFMRFKLRPRVHGEFAGTW